MQKWYPCLWPSDPDAAVWGQGLCCQSLPLCRLGSGIVIVKSCFSSLPLTLMLGMKVSANPLLSEDFQRWHYVNGVGQVSFSISPVFATGAFYVHPAPLSESWLPRKPSQSMSQGTGGLILFSGSPACHFCNSMMLSLNCLFIIKYLWFFCLERWLLCTN